MASSAAMSCRSTTSCVAEVAAVEHRTTLCAIGTTVVDSVEKIAQDGNADSFDSSTAHVDTDEAKKDHEIISDSLAAGNVGESEDGISYPDNHCIDNIPSTQNQKGDAIIAATNANVWNPLEDVDSALLSALCDPRERKALFRLEQVMIDFIKDKSSWSMEVGGAFNAIVLYQNNAGAANDNPGDYEGPDGQIMHVLSQQGLQELQHQQQRGLKQTSFQRLILHRLADRFNVIREQIIQPYFPPTGNERGLVDVGLPPHYSPGLIRLIKTNESSIPSNLLIDIDVSLLANYKNPRARNYFGGGTEDGTKCITDTMASTTLESQPSGVMSKTSKKMVIMKRSDSSSGSGSNLGLNRDNKKDKTRRKKLEDREKAYEEARARIFGISDSSGNENNGCDADHAEGSDSKQSGNLQSQYAQEYASTPLISSSCHSSFSVENDANIPLCTTAADICAAQPPTDSSPPLSESQSDHDLANLPSGATTSESDDSRRPSISSSAPAAVTKAVYRNRQQEENDPDFKRRGGVRPGYMPYVTNPYGIPLGVNPYAAMGQQPPPPQMVSMHNHSAQFYHGQTQQYQLPQDAAYATNAINNPPHQWVAPPHGYYPSLPQQQVQEIIPQPWKRPNSRQISSSVAPPNTNTSHSQPKAQPSKLPWGPGIARGDTDVSDGAITNPIVERGAASGEDTIAYTPEDFPALG